MFTKFLYGLHLENQKAILTLYWSTASELNGTLYKSIHNFMNWP